MAQIKVVLILEHLEIKVVLILEHLEISRNSEVNLKVCLRFAPRKWKYNSLLCKKYNDS